MNMIEVVRRQVARWRGVRWRSVRVRVRRWAHGAHTVEALTARGWVLVSPRPWRTSRKAAAAAAAYLGAAQVLALEALEQLLWLHRCRPGPWRATCADIRDCGHWTVRCRWGQPYAGAWAGRCVPLWRYCCRREDYRPRCAVLGLTCDGASPTVREALGRDGREAVAIYVQRARDGCRVTLGRCAPRREWRGV